MAKNSSTFNVTVKLLTDQFSKGVKFMQKQIQGLTGFIKGAFAVGTVTAFGKQMIQISSEFEDAMARVHAVSNATSEDFKRMEDEARRLGATTKYTATEAANALENLTRNGLNAQQATNALAGTLQLAQANAIGLAEAANIVTNSMNMFGLSTNDTQRINDVLSSTAANSATNISQLYEALVNAAPSARNLGLSIEEVSSALGSMAQRGYKGAEAGTQLRMALTKMVDPKIVKKMNDMGIAITEQQIKEEGLLKTVERLKDANLSLGELVGIFSQRGAQGMAQLINSYNDFERLLLITQDSAGTTARMFQQGLGETKGAILMLKSAYQEFLITVGKESKGVFNGVVKILTEVIRSFKSFENALVQIAIMVLPMFASKFTAVFKLFRAETRKAIADAIALKVATGDWVSIIATAVTWIGGYFVNAANKAHKEVKRLEEGIKDAGVQAGELKSKTDKLIETLGNEYDTKTLNGVVKEACKLFPDFKDAILEAAREADKTESYEKLKSVLQDVVKLQMKMIANQANQKAYEGFVTLGAQRMRKSSDRTKKEMGLDGVQKAMEKAGYSKEAQENVYSVILDMRIKGQSNQEIKDFLASLTGDLDKGFTSFNHAMDREIVALVGKAREARDIMIKNDKEVEDADERIRTTTEQLEKDRKKQEEKEERNKKAGEEARKQAEKIAQKKRDIDNKFIKDVSDAQNEMTRGWITAAEYQKKYAQAVKRAYEELSELDGYDNKYLKRREDVNTMEVMQKAKPIKVPTLVETPKEELQIKVHPIVDIPEIGMTMEEGLESFYKGFKTTTDGINQFGDALSNLGSAYDKLTDKNASWIDKIKATGDILNATTKMIDALGDTIELLGDKELASIIKETMVGKVKRREAAKNIAAKTGEAVAGGASSVASIPYVGPFLAGAAVASILAILAASIPKFASGGFIQGNSKYGDKLLARVNAGEAILNPRQQKRFMDLANGKVGGAAGQVQFHISGKDLIGVIRNNNIANSRISGSKGM